MADADVRAFYSFEQCRANVAGIGGFCQPNPFAAYGADKDPDDGPIAATAKD
jgi:hypothetical protein